MYHLISDFSPQVNAALISWSLTTIGAGLSLCLWYCFWKKQTWIQKKYEAVTVFIQTLVQFRNALSQVRNWRFKLHGSEDEMYGKRWDALVDARTVLEEKYILVEILTGNSCSESLEKLFGYQNELFATLDTYLQRKRENRLKWDESDKANEKIIFMSNDGSDDFSQKVEAEISIIRNILKPHLLD